MEVYILLISLLISFGANYEIEHKYFQNKFSVTLEREVLVSMNRDLLYTTIKTFKYNRTTAALNITYEFYQDVQTIKAHTIGYMHFVNVYKRTAMEFQLNVCTLLRRNVAGMDKFKAAGNMTNCPLPRGVYVVSNFIASSNDYPPLIPEGKWMFRTNFSINGMFGGVVESYVNIVYPVKGLKKQ